MGNDLPPLTPPSMEVWRVFKDSISISMEQKIKKLLLAQITLSLSPYHPLLPAGLLDYILRPYTAVEGKFLLVGQHSWTPTYGRAKAGWPARTYIQQLCEDTGCSPEDLPEVMNDREKWQERVRDIHASSTSMWRGS